MERASYKSIPGHPRWDIAPIEMAWQGRTVSEICQQLKDPQRNGGRSLELLHEHLAKDDLVAWGWHTGEGRDPAPGSQEQLGELVGAWIQAGAACPWETYSGVYFAPLSGLARLPDSRGRPRRGACARGEKGNLKRTGLGEELRMAKKTKRGRSQDRKRVAAGQDYEVRYEAKKTGKSKAAVKRATKRAGPGRKNVEKALRRKK
jgi:hypothetical protein